MGDVHRLNPAGSNTLTRAEWRDAAMTVLRADYGIDGTQVPESVWRRTYILVFSPIEAARVLAVYWLNNLSAEKRAAYHQRSGVEQ